MRNFLIPVVLVFTLIYCSKNPNTAAAEKAKNDSIFKRDTAALQEMFRYGMHQFAIEWSIRWDDTAKVFVGIQGWGDSSRPIKNGNYKMVYYTEAAEYTGAPLGKHYDYLCDDCSVSFYSCVADSSNTTSIAANKADHRLKEIWEWKYIGQRIIIFAPSNFYHGYFFDHNICPIFQPSRCITLSVIEIQPL